MVFSDILGQPTAVQTVRRALASGRLHHAYRFEGPDGVGKERCAFALARALVCTVRPREGCGECSACRRAVTFSAEPPQVPAHPDVVLVERALYPANILGRSSPETTGIGVEQIRRIVLSRAAYPPHEAPHLLFIFRAAHELTTSAANALLKTLEEPHANVHFVLLSDQPRRLIDTVRSRTLPIRFGPLPDADVLEIARRAGHALTPDTLALAAGSVRRALELCDPARVERRQRFVQAVLRAVQAPDLGAALELAASQGAERADLQEDLRGLAQHFAFETNARASGDASSAARPAHCHREVQAAQQALERNAPPSLTLEALIARLRRL
ncbi:MAG: DNA polymerase III subunit [Deltaproteobacteria bacterium]